MPFGQFTALLDRAPIGAYVVDADFRIVHVSPAARPVFGAGRDPVGEPFDRVIHRLWNAEYADEVVARFRHTLATGEPYHSSGRAEWRADRGAMEYYEWRIDRILLPDGRFGVLCYFTDISEQVAALEALAESEARYRRLFDSIDEGFCVIDVIFDERGTPVDYRFAEINPAFEKHTGLRDALGKRMRELVPLHEDHWMDAYGKVALTGEPTRFMNEARYLGGRWFDVYAFRIGGAESRRVAVLFSDVTARQHAEQVLRASAERHAFLVALGDALRPLADPERVKAEALRVLREHLGASRALYADIAPDGTTFEIRTEQRAPDVASAIGSYRFDDFGVELSRRLGGGGTLVGSDTGRGPDLTTTHRAAYGAIDVAAYIAVPLVKAGRLVAFLAVHQIEARAWSEDEVDLVQEVTERTWSAVERARAEAALRAANDELRRADRQKDEFLAMLAHELRNPLAAIANIVPVLARSPANDEAFDRKMAILNRQTHALSALVDDLLDVSRITRGRIELRLQRVDLAEVVSRAVDSMREAAADARQELRAELPQGSVPVEGDPVRLEQIVVNLLTNATRYTPVGGRITVSLRTHGTTAELLVEDTGIGLAPDALERIFGMFAQAASSSRESQGGLGIGLTIVRSLVELHGGTVTAGSAGLGQGAEFSVSLPLAAPAESPPRPAPEPAARGGKRILVVDDSVDVAEALAARLRLKGHEVTMAHDGRSALLLAQQTPPEVILLDIGMPGMNGYELARRFRQQPSLRTTALAAITGYGQPQDRERARDAGFDAHFVKPVNIDALNAFILAGGAQ